MRVLACSACLVVALASVATADDEITLAQPLVVPDETIEESEFFELAKRWRKQWSGEVGAGVNGAAGNSERFNTRLGLDAKREGPRANLIVSLLYSKGTANGEETENKFISKLRNEWKLDETPWSVYGFATSTYDEFQNWDLRLVLGSGLGYDFIKNDSTSLQGRLGAGSSREFGGADDRFIPEGNLGADFSHKLTDRQSLNAGSEYFPNFEDFGDYRLDTQASWQVVIDPEMNLTLKIGFMDRYQSRPNGAKRNDIDYFAQLGVKF